MIVGVVVVTWLPAGTEDALSAVVSPVLGAVIAAAATAPANYDKYVN